MHRTIAKGLFYGMATVLVLWTASLTYSFVAGVLPGAHWAVPLFALIVFDVGMVAWLKVFIDYAQGSGQRAVALVMCLFDFMGVGLMVIAEIFLGGQSLVAAPQRLGEYAVWGIGVWTVANVAGVIVFHLLHPETRKKMALRAEMDTVFDEALQKLGTKRARISGQLSDQLSDGMLVQLVAELAANNDRGGSTVQLQDKPEPLAKTGSTDNNRAQEDFLATGGL